MDWRVPLADIDLGVEEEEAVLKVIRSRWLTMGAVTEAFEQEFAATMGSRHAIAVANGTAALHLACLAAGLGPGDECIVPSLTFVATANAVRYCGATPVFADILSVRNLCISPQSTAACLTERTRAIIVMHYGGYPCRMEEIMAFAREHALIVIEDASHAIGSELGNRKMGCWGEIGCYSLFSNKNMTTGEGGMIVTDKDEYAERMRRLRSHGMTTVTWDRHQGHAWSYDVVALGYNYRIDEIRAAIGREQLKKMPANNEKRRHLTQLYQKDLGKLTPEVLLPFEKHVGVSACHLLPILLPENVNREAFMEQMKSRGIQTSIHYPPIHTFTDYSMIQHGPLPVTEGVATREVTLPLYATMRIEQVLWVVEAVKEALETIQEVDAG